MSNKYKDKENLREFTISRTLLNKIMYRVSFRWNV